jgi:dihydrofolate reductase
LTQSIAASFSSCAAAIFSTDRARVRSIDDQGEPLMRKIIVGAQVSLDGVMQAPGAPAEDPTRGFEFGGWAMPYFDREFGEELDRVFAERFDLLLGRRTYEIFAAYWPYYEDDAPHGGIAKLFGEIKKYVVSRSGEVDTTWKGSVLLRDIADVKRLWQEDGPNLVTQGSTELVHALLAHDLVDAISIFTVPVVLGGGKKLFADGSAPHSFRLTKSRVASNGLIVGHYEREGEVEIGDTTLDSPSEREIARRERMKREG